MELLTYILYYGKNIKQILYIPFQIPLASCLLWQAIEMRKKDK